MRQYYLSRTSNPLKLALLMQFSHHKPSEVYEHAKNAYDGMLRYIYFKHLNRITNTENASILQIIDVIKDQNLMEDNELQMVEAIQSYRALHTKEGLTLHVSFMIILITLIKWFYIDYLRISDYSAVIQAELVTTNSISEDKEQEAIVNILANYDSTSWPLSQRQNLVAKFVKNIINVKKSR